MNAKRLCVILTISMIWFQARAADSTTTSSRAPAVGIGAAIAVATLGTSTFYVVRRALRDRARGRAAVTRCEECYRNAVRSYEERMHSDALLWLDSVDACSPRYAHYTTRWRMRPAFSRSDIDSLRRRSKVLLELSGDIDDLRRTVDALPAGAEELVSVNKWPVKDTVRTSRARIRELENRHPDVLDAIRTVLSPVSGKLDRIDSLFSAVFDEQRNVFSLKSRFFYNQAIGSRDTSRIRDFVADCDYYRVDREHCERAREIFRSPAEMAAALPGSSPNTMQAEFAEVMATRRMDLMEAYIAKYSRRKKDALAANVDAVRTVYEQRKREMAALQAFNNAHPPLSEKPGSTLPCSIVGGDDEAVRIVSESLSEVFPLASAGLGSVRFPASVRIDLSQSPPLILLNAYIHRERDVRRSPQPESGITVFEIPGAPAGLNFLHQLSGTIVRKGANLKEIKGLERANYAVRLWKSDKEYLTFYGHCPDRGQDMRIFEFLDVTVRDQRDLRIRRADPFRVDLRYLKDPSEDGLSPSPTPERTLEQFFGIAEL